MTRDTVIQIRLSKEERDRLDKAAEASGSSISEYVRSHALAGCSVGLPDNSALADGPPAWNIEGTALGKKFAEKTQKPVAEKTIDGLAGTMPEMPSVRPERLYRTRWDTLSDEDKRKSDVKRWRQENGL